jgi:hypothetical protein
MTLRKNAPRAKRRWLGAGFAVAASMVLVVGAVLALATDPLAGSTFEGGDGNLLTDVTAHTDWDSAPAPVSIGIDKTSGKTDNAFGQGTKEDSAAVTVVTGAIPPNKNDLTRFYAASEFVSGKNFLYLAWERAVNIGNANMDFEINQATTAGFDASTTGAVTLARTAGDILVTYDFGGSGAPTLGILRWLTAGNGDSASDCFSSNSLPCWGNHLTLNGTNSQGAVNTVAVDDPISGVDGLGIGLFGEAAINLTDAGVFPAGTCEAFGSAFLKSRSSSSFPAEVKDFIAPVPVHISNCGEVKIRKVTSPAGGTGFDYTTTGGLSPDTFILDDGGLRDYTAVNAGAYTVSESAEAGYTLNHISCTATGSGTSITSTTNPTASFTVAPNGLVDCTFYNDKNKANPSGTSAPSLIPQDKVTVINLDTTGAVAGTADKVMTVSLYGGTDASCTGSPVYTKTFTVTANQDYVTNNSGVGPSPGGYTITTDGTYKWKVHYNGDSRNNTFDIACGAEQVVVNLTPDPA